MEKLSKKNYSNKNQNSILVHNLIPKMNGIILLKAENKNRKEIYERRRSLRSFTSAY